MSYNNIEKDKIGLYNTINWWFVGFQDIYLFQIYNKQIIRKIQYEFYEYMRKTRYSNYIKNIDFKFDYETNALTLIFKDKERKKL